MRIYWSDSKLKTIMRAYINGSEPQRVIEQGLASPDGIAVDWLGLNIYWTDPVNNRIEVSRLMGSSRRTLLWRVFEPHSIVLDPLAGITYFIQSNLHLNPDNFFLRIYVLVGKGTVELPEESQHGWNRTKTTSGDRWKSDRLKSRLRGQAYLLGGHKQTCYS